MIYSFLRSVLFLFDAEAVHYFSMNTFRFFCEFPFVKNLIQKNLAPLSASPVTLFGLHFKNPVGLGAGFDKNAVYLRELETIGFGFVEIGTVTPLPQAGNDKPRLFRLPKDKALINRMGFNNDGVDAIASRLTAWRKYNPKSTLIIGGNIGKNKQTPNEEAYRDYELCFEKLFHLVDYFVVNVSSPNTPGLRALQEKESLHKILTYLQMLNHRRDKPKPLLLKIAPDLTEGQLKDIADLAMEIKLDGLVVSNTTISREGLQTDKEKFRGTFPEAISKNQHLTITDTSYNLFHNDGSFIDESGPYLNQICTCSDFFKCIFSCKNSSASNKWDLFICFLPNTS